MADRDRYDVVEVPLPDPVADVLFVFDAGGVPRLELDVQPPAGGAAEPIVVDPHDPLALAPETPYVDPQPAPPAPPGVDDTVLLQELQLYP